MVLVVAAAMVCGGCMDSSGFGRSGHVAAREDGSLIWPYWPTSIRIHPLTRIRQSDGESPPILDARIEASDGEGMLARAVGILELELIAGHPTAQGQTVMTAWTFDLNDLAQNRLWFDDVTQTYLLPLELPLNLPVGPRRLAARLIVPGYRDLVASMDLGRVTIGDGQAPASE